MHTVLAMDASTQQLLGCMYQEPFVRQPAPKGETKAQRKMRVRESQIWERSLQAIGPVPEKQKWISVGDRGSDIYTFWQTCEQLGYDFVIRVAQDRRVLLDEEPEAEDPEGQRLKTLARSLPAQGGRVLHVPAQRQRPARDASVQMSWQEVRLQPPVNGVVLAKTEIKAWIVRVWEAAPPDGGEPLEWILVTTVPIQTVEDAWERVTWDKWRWIVEDFHKVLKTGCRIEVRRQQTVEAMCNL